MYEGRTDMEAGRILGHENLGEVVAVGDAVQRIKEGDLVCLPFNIGCGYCKNCERGLTGFCPSVESDTPGGAYGFADMGPYAGGQAEYLRVPWADFNCLLLPPGCEGEGERLRDALRHLPHRLARDRASRRQARETRWSSTAAVPSA